MEIKLLGYSFVVKTFEHSPFWNSIAQQEWEIETYQIIKRFVKKDHLVLDIGSWAGPISLFTASLAKEVHSIEPDPAIYSQLEHNVSLNPELNKKINCHRLAIHCKDGEKVLFARSKYGQSSSSLLARTYDNLSSVTCTTKTLESFVKENNIKHIDFIKLDIEGGEFELLPEISSTLKHLQYPTLYISFHSTHLKESILKANLANQTLAKILLKIESFLKINFFKNEVNEKISKALMSLKSYNNIYSKHGEKILFEELFNQPSAIKEQSFLFTNLYWNDFD